MIIYYYFVYFQLNKFFCSWTLFQDSWNNLNKNVENWHFLYSWVEDFIMKHQCRRDIWELKNLSYEIILQVNEIPHTKKKQFQISHEKWTKQKNRLLKAPHQHVVHSKKKWVKNDEMFTNPRIKARVESNLWKYSFANTQKWDSLTQISSHSRAHKEKSVTTRKMKMNFIEETHKKNFHFSFFSLTVCWDHSARELSRENSNKKITIVREFFFRAGWEINGFERGIWFFFFHPTVVPQ